MCVSIGKTAFSQIRNRAEPAVVLFFEQFSVIVGIMVLLGEPKSL